VQKHAQKPPSKICSVSRALGRIGNKKMKFNAAEFFAFAQSTQDREWQTKTGKPFTFEIRSNGIYLLPQSAKERNISNAEVVKFCALYSEKQSESTSDYKELFNKSYLLAIAQEYDLEIVDTPLPEEVGIEQLLKEGAAKQITVNKYERSAVAKRKCIEAHGTNCYVCSFNFGSFYGDLAEGFIHVHHLNPLAESEGERTVDPVQDLRPVCPNCHAVIHMRGGCLSIEEVNKLIENSA